MTVANNLHSTLKELMDIKSKRDNTNFTIYQLAKALDMPHSMLVKLMHSDPEKRVINPRIETLSKIVEFFKADGFGITIDDLLAGRKSKAIDITEQTADLLTVELSIPVFSFHATARTSLGIINVKLAPTANDNIALLSDEDVKPMFKKGSIFIVDTAVIPADENLVAAKVEGQEKILIRKLSIENNQKILTSYDKDQKPIILTSNPNNSIVGVVIQINAKT